MSSQPAWWSLLDEQPGDPLPSPGAGSPAPPAPAALGNTAAPLLVSPDARWVWDGTEWHELVPVMWTAPAAYVLEVQVHPRSSAGGWALLAGLLALLGAVIMVGLVVYGGWLSGWRVS